MNDALTHAGADFIGGILGYALFFAVLLGLFGPPIYLLIKWPRVVIPAALVGIAAAYVMSVIVGPSS